MRYVGGLVFATFLACTLVPLYVISTVAVMQVAVCPLIYLGHGSAPTDPEALKRWNPPGFTDCMRASFSSAGQYVQKIWK